MAWDDAAMTLRHATTSTVLGTTLLVARGDELAGVHLAGQKHLPGALGDQVDLDADPLLTDVAAQFTSYLTGDLRTFDLPLAPAAGAFEASVREAMLAIPYGRTTTYGTIATDLGEPRLAQAVGRAVGHNPFLVVVPCHRVLGAKGALTGYAGGVDRKTYLLDLEQHAVGATVLPPSVPARWEAEILAETEHARERDDAQQPLFTPTTLQDQPPVNPDATDEDPTSREPAAL